MLFLPKGQYPRGTIKVDNGVFHADEELVFSVVHGASWDAVDPDAPYFSEFDWASPQELRLMSSILLSEKIEGCKNRFYPLVRYSPRFDMEYLDLSSEEVLEQIKGFLRSAQETNERFRHHRSLKGLINKQYVLFDQDDLNIELQPTYWEKLSVTNFVLMRGLYALIKSEMLAAHYEFFEEAIIISYIALEASFILVKKELQAAGLAEPSAYDAAKWLHEHFDKAFGHAEPTIRYFEEFYEDRVATLHPSSRCGEFPVAPITHDDFYHLRRSLREIFAYLVARTHGPEYFEYVERARPRTP